jgi:hypothetical protein
VKYLKLPTSQPPLLAILCLLSMLNCCSLMLLAPATASAHQSGCHRWHSCPSDTGSYVCGDLGYTSGCGTGSEGSSSKSTTTTPAPNYTAQGAAAGKSHAQRDAATIGQSAADSGNTSGEKDGVAGMAANPIPDLSSCSPNWSISADPPAYTTAYHSAYTETCTALYTPSYTAAYNAAYQVGQVKHQQDLQKQAAQNNQKVLSDTTTAADTSRTSGMDWFWGIIGTTAIVWIVAKTRKKKTSKS